MLVQKPIKLLTSFEKFFNAQSENLRWTVFSGEDKISWACLTFNDGYINVLESIPLYLQNEMFSVLQRETLQVCSNMLISVRVPIRKCIRC